MSANASSESEVLVERNPDVLATRDVVDRGGCRVTVGSAGAAYLGSREPFGVFERSRRWVIGFSTVPETPADRPLDDEVDAVLTQL